MSNFISNKDAVMREINKKISEINGDVSFDVLFSEDFMSKYTDFSSFEELLKAGNYQVNSEEDFKNIPDVEFNKLIASRTRFSDWKQMMSKAYELYISQKLGS